MQRILAIHHEGLASYNVKTLYHEYLIFYVSVNKQDLMLVSLEAFLIFLENLENQAVQA